MGYNNSGTYIYPGVGTAVGLGVGLVACVIVDLALGDFFSDWIDSITK